MRAEERTRIRELLLQRRAELLADGDVPVEFANPETATKVDEDAAPLEEMTQVIASGRNRARTAALKAIDDAMRRMVDEPDEYGVCEGCDEPIPQRRLLLMPEARMCAACQDEHDKATNPRGVNRKHLTDFR